LNKNLILAGMMGVGKSTLGKALSIQLKMKFIDTDAEIEKIESETINSLFENKGEDYFRKVEKKICLDSIKIPNSIIALGGGAFINEEIRILALKECVCFWLDLDIRILKDRLRVSKKRPLLRADNINKRIADIYDQRKLSYNLANYKINCNNKDNDKIIKEIVQIYEKD
jgi:shikimate kinase